jgi:hypothetical protein
MYVCFVSHCLRRECVALPYRPFSPVRLSPLLLFTPFPFTQTKNLKYSTYSQLDLVVIITLLLLLHCSYLTILHLVILFYVLFLHFCMLVCLHVCIYQLLNFLSVIEIYLLTYELTYLVGDQAPCNSTTANHCTYMIVNRLAYYLSITSN